MDFQTLKTRLKNSLSFLLAIAVFAAFITFLIVKTFAAITPEREAQLERRIQFLQFNYDLADQQILELEIEVDRLRGLQKQWQTEAQEHRFELGGSEPVKKKSQ